MFWVDVLVSPDKWPDAARTVDAAMNGDPSAMLDGANKKDLVDLERSAVTCNDVRPFAPVPPAAFVDEALGDLERVSRFRLATVPDDGCEFWPVTPPERFQGPFNASLRNPVLIVSNTVRGRLGRATPGDMR